MSNVVADTYYWSPQGSPPNCVAFDGSVCTKCVGDYIVDNNVCVLVANFFHLTFDNNLYDKSPHRRHVKLGNVDNNFQFTTVRFQLVLLTPLSSLACLALLGA